MASSRSNDDALCTYILRFLVITVEKAFEKQVFDVYRALREKFRECDIQDSRELVNFLEKYPEVFRVFENRGQDWVAATTHLTLCPVHSQKSGSCQDRDCTGLHFCIFYLLSGQCAFASSNHDGCLFGHALEANPHNRRLLQQNSLMELNLTELRKLFCLPGVRRGVTVPKICKYYNKHRGCNKGGDCRTLHLCRPYVLEACKFGRGCRRNHDIDDQVKHVLTLYGVRVKGRPLSDILKELRRFPGNEKRDDAGSRSDDDNDDRGRCRTGQTPAYLRSTYHNRSSTRAASRNRNGSSSVQKTQEEWRNVFYVCGVFTLLGAVVFGAFAVTDVEPWAKVPDVADDDVRKLEIQVVAETGTKNGVIACDNKGMNTSEVADNGAVDTRL